MEVEGHKFVLLLKFILYFVFMINISNSEEILPKFNGAEIKLLAYHYSPLFSYKKLRDGNYSFEGLYYEYMQDAQLYFDIKYKYVIADEVEVKKYGLSSVFLNYLDKKEVDIIPYVFYQELNNLKHMELTTTVWIDPLAIMQPYPEQQNRLHVPIKPFQFMLWITFFGTTIFFILTTSIFVKVQERADSTDNDRHQKSFGETMYRQFEYVIRIITSQEGYYLVRYQSRKSFKILIGFWLISMVALINAYTSVMTALLTVPKLEPIANTLEEAVIQNRCVTMETNTPVSRDILEAKEGYEKKMGDQFRNDPTLWTADPLTAMDNVLNRKCVYPTAMLMINYIVYQDTKSNGRCRMTVSAELKAYNQLPFQMGFPIKSPIATAFNGFFLRINAAGIVDYYKDRFFPSSRQCRTDVPSKNTIRSLTLFDLTAPFLIIGVGLSLSILAFLIEIVVYFIKDRLDY